jgi:hypothetical protein
LSEGMLRKTAGDSKRNPRKSSNIFCVTGSEKMNPNWEEIEEISGRFTQINAGRIPVDWTNPRNP